METTTERRVFDIEGLELRADEGKKPILRGHAAVFNKDTTIGGGFGFIERIAPGAFAESIGEDDVRALFNHDPNIVLGRNKAGTLRLAEDKKGLAIEIDPPDTQAARDLIVSIQRGDISQMSFGFQTLEQEWQFAEKPGKADVRTLKKVKLFDVSPVTFAAYSQTDVAVRMYDHWRKEQDAMRSGNWRLRMALVERDEYGVKRSEEAWAPLDNRVEVA